MVHFERNVMALRHFARRASAGWLSRAQQDSEMAPASEARRVVGRLSGAISIHHYPVASCSIPDASGRTLGVGACGQIRLKEPAEHFDGEGIKGREIAESVER